MAITFFAEAVVPADGAAATNTNTQNTITWPSNMKVGDLVFVCMQQRGTATMSVGVTGNQVWNTGFRHTGTSIAAQYFWCRFNGDSSTNARFDFSAGTCTSVVMLVFRPTDVDKYWAIDLEPSLQSAAAAANITITGNTTTRASSVSLGVWMTADDNTWGSLSGTGWSKTGLTAQYRNTSGTDQSMTIAYNIRTSTGTVANVTQTQATLGNDAAIMYFLVFYERETEYIGDPTIYGSTFAGGQRTLVHKSVARSAGNCAIMRIRAYSTRAGGADATIYPVLFKINGATHEFCAIGNPITVTTTEAWYSGIIFYTIVPGTTYEVGYWSGHDFDFRYVFRSDWTSGESWDTHVGTTSLPTFSNISVGSETNNYQTHQSLEIQFSTQTNTILQCESYMVSALKGKGKGSTVLQSEYFYSISNLTFATEGNDPINAILQSTFTMTASGVGKGKLTAIMHPESYMISEMKGKAQGSAILWPECYLISQIKGKGQGTALIQSESTLIPSLIGKGKLTTQLISEGQFKSNLKGIAKAYATFTSSASLIGNFKAKVLVSAIFQGESYLLAFGEPYNGLLKKYNGSVWVAYRLKSYNGIDVRGCPVRLFNQTTQQWETVKQL